MIMMNMISDDKDVHDKELRQIIKYLSNLNHVYANI